MARQNMQMVNPKYTPTPMENLPYGLSEGGSLGTFFILQETFTIEFWVISTGSDDVQALISAWAEFGIGIENNGLLSAPLGCTSTSSLVDGIPHHVAFVATPQGSSLFIDGVLEDSSTSPSSEMNLGVRAETYYVTQDKYNRSLIGSMFSLALWESEKYTQDFTPPTSRYVGDEPDLLHYYPLDRHGMDYVGRSYTNNFIYPGDSNIQYSPYNWVQGEYRATTIYAGAYFKFTCDSSKVFLHFDAPSKDGNSTVVVYVDGALMLRQSADTVLEINVPERYVGHHIYTYEVVIDTMPSTGIRWMGTEQACHLSLIELSEDGVMKTPPSLKPNKIIIYGDSITEGVDTGYLGSRSNSAIGCYPRSVAIALNSELGVVGTSGLGFQKGGEGSVPKFPDSYGFIINGVPRDFSDEPDLCIWVMGINDKGNPIIDEGIEVLNGLLSLTNSMKVLVLRPFLNATQEDSLKAMIAGCSDPSRAIFGDTQGFLKSNMVHPFAWEHTTSIAHGITGLASGHLIEKEYTGETSTATVEAKGIPDGTYKTTLNLNGECVFYGDLNYTDNFATATGVKCVAGNKLTGSVFDNQGNHTKCAGLTSTSF